jgi:hypothetical protein
MKNMETEKEIVDLIVKTLGEGEEQYILGSWENFAKKRKEKRRMIFWFSGTGIAAGLLVGWLGFRLVFTGSFAGNADSVRQDQMVSKVEPLVITKEPAIQSEKRIAEISKNNVVSQNYNGKAVIYQASSDMPGKKSEADQELIVYPSDSTVPTQEIRMADPKADSARSGLPLSGNLADRGKTDTINKRSDTLRFMPLYSQTGVYTIKDEDNQPDKIRPHKFRIGVNIAPGVTTTNTTSSFNYSGGVNADYELSGRFRISTGVQVEHQNVKSEGTAASSWMPAEKSQAMLVDLDIPLNIAWKFLIKKSTCYYVSGGISSIAYLSEKYTETSYSQKVVQVVNMKGGEPNVTYQVETVAKTDQQTNPPLSQFDFAGRINIIFGYEQHLSSKLFLHIEPYLKIPVSDLAAQDLRFTMSGITCKISF